MRRFRSLLLLSVFLGLSTSCTKREVDTSIKFDIKSMTSNKLTLSSNEIFFAVINIKGPNMQPIFWKWEDHNSTSSLPSEIRLSVPAGDQRMIQFLAVGRDSTTNSLNFLYGDSTVAIAGAKVDVPILLTTFASANGVEADVMGRYAFADGSTYTGPIEWNYKPSGTAPMMTLGHREMFSGWFRLFVLDQVKFVYRLPEKNHVLFGGPLEYSSSALATASSVMHIKTKAAITTIYRDENHNSTYDPGIDETEPSLNYIFGFWKGGVSDTGKTICRDNNPSVLSTEKYTSATFSGSELSWPGDFDFLSDSPCTISSDIISTSSISVPANPILNSGGDILLTGPYEKFLDGSHYTELGKSHTTSTLSLQWKYLPEVNLGENALLGSTVFTKLNAAGEKFDDDDPVDCTTLPAKGYQQHTPLAYPIEAYNITGISAQDASNIKVVVCPYNSKGFLKTVAQNYCDNCSSSNTLGSFDIFGVKSSSGDTIPDHWLGGSLAQPQIQWGTSSGAEYYHISIRDSGDTTDICSFTTASAITDYEFSAGCSLTEGTSYLVKVKAVANGGADFLYANNSGYVLNVDTTPPSSFSTLSIVCNSWGAGYKALTFTLSNTITDPTLSNVSLYADWGSTNSNGSWDQVSAFQIGDTVGNSSNPTSITITAIDAAGNTYEENVSYTNTICDGSTPWAP